MPEQTPESQTDAALVETELHRAVDVLADAVGTLADLLRRPDVLMVVAAAADNRQTYGRLEPAAARLDAIVRVIDQVGGTVAGLNDVDDRIRKVAANVAASEDSEHASKMAHASAAWDAGRIQPRPSVLDMIDFGDDDQPRQGKTWTEADSF